MTCIHCEYGLCQLCQELHDEDPGAWREYGYHPAGIANAKALKEWMEARSDADVPPDAEIPY